MDTTVTMVFVSGKSLTLASSVYSLILKHAHFSGSSVAMASVYKVMVEKVIVFSTDSLYGAVSYLFGCFYVFNMQYPKELLATFEFIQRYGEPIFSLKLS